MHSRPPEIFCHGDEENECHACMGRHSTTADQSEIREAYLVSVMATRKMHTFLRPIHYCPDLEDFIAPNVEKM